MKIFLYSTIVVTTLFTSACKKIAIDFNQHITEMFKVQIVDQIDGKGLVQIDLTSNFRKDDLEKHRTEIKSIQINQVKLLFSEYTSSNPQMISGIMKLKNIDNEEILISETDVKDYAENKKEKILVLSQELRDKLSGHILNSSNESLEVYFQFESMEVPVGFTVNLLIELSGTYNK